MTSANTGAMLYQLSYEATHWEQGQSIEVSKLIERVVFNQLYEYLNNNNLLTESQSGFRPMFSTETALLEVTNEWLWNIDNSLLNGVVFLELKKAFDTMDHAILLGKGSVLNLLTGSSPIYLTESNKRSLMVFNPISVI